MKTVFSARTVTEARLVCGLLEVEGITTTLKGESLAGIAGDVPCDDTWPQVQVEDTDAEKAQSVVDGYIDKRTPTEGPPWTCESCGETHQPQFGECWSCGHARP